MERWGRRVLYAGVFLLPLLCWPGLEHPFSTPKIWLLAALDLGLAVHVLLRKPKPPSAPPAADWPWLIWLAAPGLSSLTAPYASMDALLLTALPLPLCWLLRQGQLSAQRLSQALLWGSLIESAIVVLQFCALDPLLWLGWQPEEFSISRMRIYGTLGNPDFVAAWLCTTLPLYIGALQKRVRSPWLAALALQLAGILATGSREFLLALPVGAVVLAARGWRPRKRWFLGLPLAAALLWFSTARPLGVTVQGRWYLDRVTTSHWQQVPLLGCGPGSFGLKFAGWQVEWLRTRGAQDSVRQFAGELDHAHNDYLELWVEYGPIGLAAFLVLSAWLIGKAWRRGPGGDPRWEGARWAALACLAVIACVDFPFHRPAEWGLYWLLLGML